MNPSRKLLFATALLAMGMQAAQRNLLAQEDRWVRIDRNADRAVYVDRLSARVVDSTVVEVWVSMQFINEQRIADKKYNRMVGLVRLDCRAHQVMLIENNFYLDGQFQKRVPFPPESRDWSNERDSGHQRMPHCARKAHRTGEIMRKDGAANDIHV